MTSTHNTNEAPKAHEEPSDGLGPYRFNPELAMEETPLFKALGVYSLKQYPGGIREGLKKFFAYLGIDQLDTQETKELLAAVQTNGFRFIPSRILTKERRLTDFSPEFFLQQTGDRIEWLTAVIRFLLDELYPDPDSKKGYFEDMATGERVASPMEKRFDEIVPKHLVDIADAHREASLTVNPAPRRNQLNIIADNVVQVDINNVPEGVDPLEHLIGTVSEAWRQGVDVLSIEGMRLLNPETRNSDSVDLAAHWSETTFAQKSNTFTINFDCFDHTQEGVEEMTKSMIEAFSAYKTEPISK